MTVAEEANRAGGVGSCGANSSCGNGERRRGWGQGRGHTAKTVHTNGVADGGGAQRFRETCQARENV